MSAVSMPCICTTACFQGEQTSERAHVFYALQLVGGRARKGAPLARRAAVDNQRAQTVLRRGHPRACARQPRLRRRQRRRVLACCAVRRTTSVQLSEHNRCPATAPDTLNLA